MTADQDSVRAAKVTAVLIKRFSEVLISGAVAGGATAVAAAMVRAVVATDDEAKLCSQR